MDKITVQIVEDDSVSAKISERNLLKSGYIISAIVKSGEEAIKSAEKNRPDVILMDIKLNSEMDGIEAAGKIKSLFDIPVIFVSAHSDEKILERAMITEPFGFIVKPFQNEELIANISMAIYKNKIERKLKESEYCLKEAQAITHIGHWKLDASTKEVSGSDELFNIFGLSRAGPTLDAFLEVVHPDNREFVLHSVNRGLEHGKSWDIEHRLLLKNGTEKTVHAIGRAVKDNKGGVVQLIGTVQDITERKLREESLKTKTYQQAILSELGKKALAGLDIQLLMNDIVNVVANTLKVEYCKVLELLPDEKSFLLCAGVGWKDGLVGHTTVNAGSDSQAGYTLQYNRPVIVKDLQKETRFLNPSLLTDHGVVSGISVVIAGTARPFGVLGVHTTRKLSFTEEDIYFLQSVSNLLANAIQRKKVEVEREEVVQKLQKALGEIKTLKKELVHICASCKKIRNDEGHWKHVDEYLLHHTDSKPNHAICPDCSKLLYPEIYDKDKKNGMDNN